MGIAFALVTLGLPVASAYPQRPAPTTRATDYAIWNIPEWAAIRLEGHGFRKRYDLVLEVNPFFQRGDFDGDGKPDIALLVRHRQSGKRGIVVLHQATPTPHVLGAGATFGNGGDDWSWLWVWRVHPDFKLSGELPSRREILYVAKPEAAGAHLYWDGRRYQWKQVGD